MAPSIPRRSSRRRATSPPCTAEDGGGRLRTRAAVYREQSIDMNKKKKKMVMDGDAPYIPQEIITNILKLLPVKSLIRFQCVCKDWKNLFKTPSFIAEHLRHSTLQNDFLIFKSRSYQSDCGRLRSINRDMKVLQHHTPSSVRSCSIVGSINGLLCLSSESFILWNPATREFLHVPQEPDLLDHFMINHVGFGFSPIVDDYKIVRLSISIPFDDDDKVYLVQVFSFSTWSWKEVEAKKLQGITPFVCKCGFTFDGAIFWFGFKPGGIVQEDWLISFDIATESFTLIPIPTSAPVVANSRLTTHENKLAIVSKVGDGYRTGMRIGESFRINLWVMEKFIDESGEKWIWTKIYSVNPYLYGIGVSSLETIWRNEIFGEAGGVADKDVRKLFKCNFLTNEFKMLAIGKYNIGTQIWNYAESLVSLGNIHNGSSTS